VPTCRPNSFALSPSYPRSRRGREELASFTAYLVIPPVVSCGGALRWLVAHLSSQSPEAAAQLLVFVRHKLLKDMISIADPI
jgi:hypothetical protein